MSGAMGIELEIRHLEIPFRFTYGHSKASHRGVALVVCVARDSEGLCGYGEAVPRTYVTGETCDSVMQDVGKHAVTRLRCCADAASVRAVMIECAGSWEGAFPSCAFCAVEVALLDLFSRQRGEPFYAGLGERQVERLTYSASIGLGKSAFVTAQLLAYRALGFTSFKLKVGGAQDLEALKLARAVLGRDVKIFVDANGAWNRETAARKADEFSAAGVWGIEEPLHRRDAHEEGLQLNCEQTLDERHFEDNAWLRSRSPIPLIADESVISMRSMRAAIDHRAFDVVNVRLSKLGGAMLASHIVTLARENGMPFYVGAMVGETPILAAAGSHFGVVHADHRCIQGYSHQALYRDRMAAGGAVLRRKGALVLKDEPGLGVAVSAEQLDRMTRRKERFEW